MLRCAPLTHALPKTVLLGLLLACLLPSAASATRIPERGSKSSVEAIRELVVSFQDLRRGSGIVRPEAGAIRAALLQFQSEASDLRPNDPWRKVLLLSHIFSAFEPSSFEPPFPERRPLAPGPSGSTTVVPEPSTALLMLLGLAGLASADRRFRA